MFFKVFGIQSHPRQPKMAQDTPKMAQDRPKTAQNRPRTGPRCIKMAQDRPKMPQDRRKMAHDRPKTGPGQAQDAPRQAIKNFKVPKICFSKNQKKIVF